MATAAIAASTAVLGLCWYLRRLVPDGAPRAAASAGEAAIVLSWSLLVARFAAGILLFDPRPNAAALIQQGLSAQNQVQVAVTMAAALWAAYLLLGRRVTIGQLLSGPRYWVSLLLVSYLASALWSMFPELTLYRTFELAVFFVIVTHLFAAAGEARLRALVLVLVVLMIAYGLWLAPGSTGSGLVAALRHNQGGMITALWICLIIARAGEAPLLRAAELAVAAVVFVLFGSLASLAALGVGLVTLAAASVPARMRPPALIAAAAAGVACVYLYLAGLGGAVAAALTDIGRAFGKTDELLLTLSGRLPYWRAMWDVAGDQPFGMGFAAAERLLGLDFDLPTVMSNAHSGYVSAWLGSGWIGLALCLAVFAAAGVRALQLPGRQRAVHLALLAVLAANNVTVAAVGGPFNPGFMVLMALIAPLAARARPAPA